MTTFTRLPMEIRQQILLDAIQQETQIVGQAWPRTTLSLLHTNKLLRHDMLWVINIWSPLWVLQYPYELTAVPPLSLSGPSGEPSLPTLHRLRINVFHEADDQKIKMADRFTGWSEVVHAELVSAWINAVESLHQDVEEVLVDVTPAPKWLRENKRRQQLLDLLLDNRVARCFLNEHVDDMSDLVKRIHKHYDGKITIKLTGILSRRSERFVLRVAAECMVEHIALVWVGEYVSPEQRSAAQLQRLVHSIALKNKPLGIDKEVWQKSLRLAPLRKIGWSDKSVGIFGRVYEEVEVENLREEIAQMAELMVKEGGGSVEMTPAGSLRRALVHSLAQDMGLRTASEGEGTNRYVVITR
jgi:hypothetical protein